MDHPQAPGGVEAERQIALNPLLVVVRVRIERDLEESAEIERESVDSGVDLPGDLFEADRRMCTIGAMSDLVHAVEGYALCCSCAERWVPEAVASRLAGRCHECYREDSGARLGRIEVVGRGGRVTVPLSRKRRRKAMTPGRAQRRKLNAKAKDAARRRLAAMFPDAYDILLAEERGQRGLEPWPAEVAARGGDPEADLAFAELQAELDARGVTVS